MLFSVPMEENQLGPFLTMAGTDAIEILEGVNEGDELVISDVSEYEDVKNVRLKNHKEKQ